MANTSIFAAFERMWQHNVALVGGKANAEHEHDNYIPVDEKGAPNGVATLNESGIIPSSQLPSYVDDVLEFADRASFPATGESGKIYVDTATNVTYRWSGSTYTEISKSLALGTTDSTAAAGNHGHKLSDLENDSGFATEQYVDEEIEDHDTSPLAHANKMNSENPVGEGSFSLNRKSGSTIGIRSFAEGINTEASGDYSHAEGQNTIAEGKSAHAEGADTEAEGDYSHAEGERTYAHGAYSHVEGQYNHAHNDYAHVEGCGNSSSSDYSHVQGKYSIGSSNAAHVVGNGSEDQGSNAHTLDWNGNAWFAGDVYVGSESGRYEDEGSKKLATEEYVDREIESIDLTGKLSRTGDTMTGPIEFIGTSNVIDFDTSGWIRGKTASGGRYDIFGYSNPTTLQVGGSYPALSLKGKNTRPTYNDAEMALLSDVSSDVFIAEYGVTTLEDINAAYNAGKQLMCKYTPEGSTQIWCGFGWRTGTNVYSFTLINHNLDYIIARISSSGTWNDLLQLKLASTKDGAFTSAYAAQNNTNYTTKQVRNIILVADGEEIPAGANGDICLVYAP